MREMKDSGVEWIGEIPETWIVERLQWHLDEIKESNSPIKTTQVLSLTNKAGVIPYEDKGEQGNKAKENYDEYKLAYPDTIVANSMNILIGSVGICRYFGCVSPVYYVFKPKENELLSYLNYVFQMEQFQKELRRYANGILEIRLRLSSANIIKRYVAFPSHEEQIAISHFLDRKCTQIDALISNAQQQIEKLKAYKQSVITETVTKGLDPDVPMKYSGVEWIGEIPEHCSLVPMKYLAEEIGDGIHSTPNYDINGDIFFINGNNIGEERLHFKESTNKLNAKEFANYKAPLLTDNTILITLNGATYGKTSFYNNEPVLLGKSAGYITLKPYVNKRYIRYYLQSSISKLIMDLSLAGTTIQNVSLRTLNTFTVVYPQINEQERIVTCLDHKCSQIDNLIALKQQKIEKLQQYKKSLIYEYVTGKKEV